MVDLPEGTVFRTVFEERVNDIAMTWQTDGRMLYLQSYDYTVPNILAITAFETAGGKPFVMEVLLSKSSKGFVDQQLDKAMTDYDKVP